MYLETPPLVQWTKLTIYIHVTWMHVCMVCILIRQFFINSCFEFQIPGPGYNPVFGNVREAMVGEAMSSSVKWAIFSQVIQENIATTNFSYGCSAGGWNNMAASFVFITCSDTSASLLLTRKRYVTCWWRTYTSTAGCRCYPGRLWYLPSVAS